MTSEFVREGLIFTNGKMDCTVSQLHSLTAESDLNTTSPYDPSTHHVELSMTIGMGVNFRDTIEELVQFAQHLHPFVAFIVHVAVTHLLFNF